jgi:putative inorganic carbon (HCO3(-)) transporter
VSLIPRQEIVQFLESGEGLAAATVLFAAVALGAFALLFVRLRRIERADDAGSELEVGGDLGRAIASVVAVACVLLPLVFTIASEDVFALPKTLALWSTAVAAAVLVAVALARDPRLRRLDTLSVAVLAFAGLTALATVLSIDPGHSLAGQRLQYQGLLSTLAYVVLFVAARLSLTSGARVQGVALGLLASATIAAIYAIAQGLSLDPIWSTLYKDRVFSTVGQANALASVLGMATLLSLALVAGRRRRVQAIVLIGALVTASGLVLTLSRGGYLGMVAGVVVAGLVLAAGRGWSVARTRVLRVAFAALGAILLVGAVVIVWRPANAFAGQIAQRAFSIPAVTETSNRSHLDMWEVGIRIAVEHPIIGTGPDTYVLLFGDYRDRVLTPDRAAIMARFSPESAHNVYISTAAGAGFPALIAYLAVIGLVFAAGVRAARQDVSLAARLTLAGLLGAVAVHLVTDAFMTAEPSASAIFWILLGATAGYAGRLTPDVDELEAAPTPAGIG